MTKRNKLWEIETVDELSREGVDFLLARTEDEARIKAKTMFHHGCDCAIVSCESILGSSLAEVRGKLGETYFFETYRQLEDGTEKRNEHATHPVAGKSQA